MFNFQGAPYDMNPVVKSKKIGNSTQNTVMEKMEVEVKTWMDSGGWVGVVSGNFREFRGNF